MKIGLLSDTHGYLDSKVLDYFKNVDEIWHAGDIGGNSLVETLENYKPFRAVYGNIDSDPITHRFPEDQEFECEGVKIWMTHIGGTPPNYNKRVKLRLDFNPPDLFICGHSHIMKAQRDVNYNNMLYLNPGAAGNHGFHHIKTIVRLELKLGQVKNLEVIELGRRGEIK